MTAAEYCQKFSMPISYTTLENGNYLRFHGSGIKESNKDYYAFLAELTPDYRPIIYHTLKIYISKRDYREYILYGNKRMYLDQFTPIIGGGDFIDAVNF